MSPKKINPFVGGRIMNFRGSNKVIINNSEFEFKIDKNYSVYDVVPRKIELMGNTLDCLSVVHGQVPQVAHKSLEAAMTKWLADIERYQQQS